MNKFIYYFDKWTAWLDFSWIIITPKNKKEKLCSDVDYIIDPYVVDPYFVDPYGEAPDYEVEPLLR